MLKMDKPYLVGTALFCLVLNAVMSFLNYYIYYSLICIGLLLITFVLRHKSLNLYLIVKKTYISYNIYLISFIILMIICSRHYSVTLIEYTNYNKINYFYIGIYHAIILTLYFLIYFTVYKNDSK